MKQISRPSKPGPIGLRMIGRRPLCTLCLASIFSGLMAVWLPEKVFLWLVGAGLLVGMITIAAVKLGRMHFYTACMMISLLLAVLLGFATSARYYSGIVRRLEARAGEVVTVEGTIAERTWSAGYAGGYLLKAESINGRPDSTKILLDCAFAADPAPGERVRACGILTPFSADVNGFAERRYYLANNVAISLLLDEPEQLTALGAGTPSLRSAAAELNENLGARLRLFAGREGGSLLSALLLGRQDDLSDSVIRDFKRLGLSHVLALSGMHLTLLCATVGWLLTRLGIPRGWRTCLQLTFVGGYVLLTGVSISVLRAAVMLTLTCIASALFDEADPLTSLWCAATLICLATPAALLDLGLWMSVFATLAMLLCGRLTLTHIPTRLRNLTRAAIATFAATMMTLPFVALCNGEFAWLAIPANLVFVPLTTLLLYASPFVLLCRSAIGFTIGWLSEVTLDFAAWLARLSNITLSLQSEAVQWSMIPFGVMGLLLILHPPKRLRTGVIAMSLSGALVLVSAGVTAFPRGLDIVYAGAGQSETLVLREAEGTLICDLGDGSFTPLRNAAVLAARLGTTEIDTLMLTHYHTRHISAVKRLADTTTLRRLLLPTPNTDREREIVRDITEHAALLDLEIAFYPDGIPIHFGEATLTPHTRTLLERSTQPLLLLHLSRGGEGLTYIGASVGESELAELADAYAGGSQRIILGAHGPIPKVPRLLPLLPSTTKVIAADRDMLTYNLPSDEDVARGLLISIAERVYYKMD